MTAAAKSAASSADVVDKASIRMGIPAEEYQKLAHAAELSGVQMTTMEKAAKNLQASGSKLSFDEALDQIMAVTDESERAAKAAEMFGDKAAYDMAPLLAAGADGIAAMKKEAEDMGIVMSEESIKSGAAMNDAFTKIEKAVGSVKNQIGTAFMPILADMLEWFVTKMPAIQETVGKVVDFITLGIEKLRDFWSENGEKITAITSRIWDAIKKVIETAMNIISGVIEVVTGVMSGDWEKVFNGFKKIAGATFDLIKEMISLALDAIIGTIKSFGSLMFNAGESLFTYLWDGLKSVWTAISSWVLDKVEWVADKLTFWKSSQKEMSDNDRGGSLRDGSHASGLPFVPYDGYMIEAHRGETLLNPSGTQDLISGIINGVVAAVGMNQGGGAPSVAKVYLDSREIAQAIFDPLKNESRQRGVSLA